MNIKKIQFKNFRSYSNHITEINFNDVSSFNLIVGRNGSGKSTLAHVIQYLLYGRIDGVNNKDLANRINRELWGKIDIDCSGHLLEIERGLYPTVFRVKIDGEDYDVAGKLDVQRLLEEKYYKINYNIFKSLIILNINEFKSLVELSPADKKKILDKIFGFGILNQIFDNVKGEFNSLNASLSNIDAEISMLDKNIESTKARINGTSDSDSMESLASYSDKLNDLMAELSKVTDTKTKLDNINETLNNNIRDKKTQVNLIDNEISQINKKINLFKNSICPLCGSDLTGDHYVEESNKLKQEIIELNEQKKAFKQSQDELVDKLSVVKDKFDIINSKITSLNNDIVAVRASMGAIKKIKSNASSIDNLLAEFCDKLDCLLRDREEMESKVEFIRIVMDIFSQNGVKKYVNQIYVPMVNNLIAEMSDKLQLFYKVEFDADFNCKIYQNGIEVNYSTLSSGEKRRLDLATIVAFIKLLKIQSASSNVMFLDEILSVLDINAIDQMIDILTDLSNDLKCNIFLIHHADLESSRFDKVYTITKHSMFSEITEN